MVSPRRKNKPLEHPVPANVLKRIFERAELVRKLAPWEFLEESQLFGLQLDGEDGEVFWINTIGSAGEVFAINFYRGDEGFKGLCVMLGSIVEEEESDMEIDPMSVAMEQCMFQIEFVSKRELDSWDRKALKKVGKSLPSNNRSYVPRITSLLPGFLPWRPDEEEGSLIADLLDCVYPILMANEEDPDVYPDFPDADVIPVWTRSLEGKLSLRLQDTDEVFTRQKPRPVHLPSLDEFSEQKLASLPRSIGARWEIATSLAPSRIEEKGKRPYIPYSCLLCDSDGGAVLAIEVFQKKELGENVGKILFKSLELAGAKPESLVVAEPALAGFLKEWLAPVGIDVSQGDCPACFEAFDALEERFG